MQDYNHEENWMNEMMDMPTSDVSLVPDWGFDGAEAGQLKFVGANNVVEWMDPNYPSQDDRSAFQHDIVDQHVPFVAVDTQFIDQYPGNNNAVARSMNAWNQENNTAFQREIFGPHVASAAADYGTQGINYLADNNGTIESLNTWTQDNNAASQQNGASQHVTSAAAVCYTQMIDQHSGGMMYSTPQAMAMATAFIPSPIPLGNYYPRVQATAQRSAPTAATFACTQPGCQLSFKRDTDRIRHEASKHGINGTLHFCQVLGCSKSLGAGYTRKDKLTEHMWKKHGNLGFTKRIQ